MLYGLRGLCRVLWRDRFRDSDAEGHHRFQFGALSRRIVRDERQFGRQGDDESGGDFIQTDHGVIEADIVKVELDRIGAAEAFVENHVDSVLAENALIGLLDRSVDSKRSDLVLDFKFRGPQRFAE